MIIDYVADEKKREYKLIERESGDLLGKILYMKNVEVPHWGCNFEPNLCVDEWILREVSDRLHVLDDLYGYDKDIHYSKYTLESRGKK